MSVFVVVDAYSTGAAIGRRLAQRGVQLVHVRSIATPPPFYARAFREQDFVADVVHEGDLDATLAQLARWDVAAVLPGTEIGVPLADALAERLGLPGNDTARSRARRSKHAMAQALRAHGLDAVAQLKTDDVDAAVAWARARDDWPVVVKPVDSAGTDGVVFCDDAAHLRATFGAQLHHDNQLFGCNDELLVQELLRGTQYFINSVSWNGVHHVSEVWRDTRLKVEGAGRVPFHEDLVERHGPEQDVVTAYVEGVLDALGIRYGAGHAEVMLTDRGPVLIECAARTQGTMLAEAVERCTPSHVTVTVDAYLDPRSVARRAQRPYELRAHARCVALISEQDGRISSCARLAELERLASWGGSIAVLGVGDRIRRTVDLFSSPGTIYLIHPDRDELERDYLRLRELEREGLFEIDELVAA
jgi:biotin carboxylase